MTTATAKKLSRIFNGTITLINKDTETYVTLKISTVKNGKLEGKRIVSQLVGSDNVNSYQGFAFVNEDDTIKVWRSKHTDKRQQIAVIVRSLMLYGDQSQFANKVDMKLSKLCMRCNRKLTTPQSIADGIGPICIDLGGILKTL